MHVRDKYSNQHSGGARISQLGVGWRGSEAIGSLGAKPPVAGGKGVWEPKRWTIFAIF